MALAHWSLAAVLILTLATSRSFAAYQSLPDFDLSGFQQIALVGHYSGVSYVTDTNQYLHADPGAVLSLNTNSTFDVLTTLNGNISASCTLPTVSGSFDLYMGGNFSMVGSQQIANIAGYHLDSNTIFSLAQGLDGPVNTLLCDSSTNAVYAGGNFLAPIDATNDSAHLAEFGGNVAVWQNNSWSAVPWKGLNGPVNTIVRTQHGSIVFGGQFDSTTDGIFNYTPTSQPVSLTSPAVISSGNSASTSGYNNPNSTICANGASPWLLQDNQTGYWQATFPYGVTPSLFRLTNTNYQGRGTQNFSILALGSNQAFNLSYIDPTTHQLKYCSENCTLVNDASFTDFSVVIPIITSGVRIDITSWYGAGGGLSGVQIFQSEIIVYANNAINQLNCSGSTVPTTGLSVTNGTWTSSETQGSSQQWLLTSSTPTSDIGIFNATINFIPTLPEAGNYSVYVLTPGCVSTDDCSKRTQVEYTTIASPYLSVSTIVGQTNASDSYTLIYSGWISATSSTFQPHVLMSLAKNASLPSSKTTHVVAVYVQFVKEISNQQLNSVLEYHVDTWLSNSSVSAWSGLTNDSLPRSSIVNYLDASTPDLFIGGEFNSTTYTNIVRYSYSAAKMVPLASTGLNGAVNTLWVNGSHMFVGGNFSAAINASQVALNNLAMYDLSANAWNPIQQGTNGPVTSIVPIPIQNSSFVWLSVSGSFSSIGSGILSSGTEFLNLNINNWIANSPFISGTIRQSFMYSNNTILVGSIRSAETYLADGISIVDGQTRLNELPFYPSNLDYRTNTGMFWTDPATGNSSMIVGGYFQLSNGVQNIALLENGVWNGLQITNWQGEITSVTIAGNYLYMGGNFTALTSSGQNITALAIWDLVNDTYVPVQQLQNDDGSLPIVNVARKTPDGTGILVGGRFTHVGSLPCPSLCLLDTKSLQWSSVGANVSGTVLDFDFVSNQLLVVGDMIVNGSPAYLALVNNDMTWNVVAYQNVSGLPGLPNSILYDSTNGKAFISGKNTTNGYISEWTGNQNLNLLTSGLDNTSDISQLFMVPSSLNSQALGKGGLIMLVGNIAITGYGNLSAALFDGNRFYPYMKTSALDGSTGSIRSMFFSSCCPDISQKHYLPVPIVILISVAIALGLVFFIVLGALLIMHLRRSKESRIAPKGAPEAYVGKPPRRPQSLLAMLMPAAGAALLADRDSLASPLISNASGRPESNMSQHRAFSTGNRLGSEVLEAGGAGVANGGAGHLRSRRSLSERNTPDPILPPEPVYFPMPSRDSALSDVTNYRSSFAAAVQIAAKNNADNAPPSEERPHLYFAKYEFKAREHGELGFNAGDRIIVVDANDDIWWMGYKNNGFGELKQGVFPSNYVEKAPAAVNTNNPFRNSAHSRDANLS